MGTSQSPCSRNATAQQLTAQQRQECAARGRGRQQRRGVLVPAPAPAAAAPAAVALGDVRGAARRRARLGGGHEAQRLGQHEGHVQACEGRALMWFLFFVWVFMCFSWVVITSSFITFRPARVVRRGSNRVCIRSG
jgi:hypothetical protein